MHFDTHTDLGHVHGGEFNDLNLASVPFTILPEMYTFLNSGQRTPEALAALERNLRAEGLTGPQAERVLTYIQNAPPQEAIDMVEREIRSSVHDIAQPIVGALASDVSQDVDLMLPPPSSARVGRSPVGPNGRVISQDTVLYMCGNNDIFLATKGDDPIGADRTNQTHFWPIADGQYVEGFEDCSTRGGNISLSAIQANTEGFEGPIGTLNGALNQDKFILDLDLDGLVSNGVEGDLVVPVSNERTHSRVDKDNILHDTSNENDERIAVAKKEMDLIQERMDYLFESLAEVKRNGKEPAVISISDSTFLRRAMSGQFDDWANGGNYTPSCLVFLLNYQVRQKLKELYPNAKFPVETP